MRRLRIPAAAIAGALAVAAFATPPASTAPDERHAPKGMDHVNTKKLREAVTIGGIMEHERVLQRIANNNGGTRASGTPGYRASAQYVKRTLRSAGYQISQQRFTFPFFRDLSPASLQQVSPAEADYETETMTFSGSGDVTGALVPIDVTVPAPPEPSSTSGCEASDFPSAPGGPVVALIQRGSCSFEQKAANAADAGYDAVVMFNEGQDGRTELLTGTLGRPFEIPVVGLSYADGEELYNQAQSGDVEVHVVTDTEIDTDAKTTNVFAQTPRGNPKQTVVVGAHLDSVVDGAGINDNGSGTATMLEIAEEMAEMKRKPQQRVRFAFWGAEEFGLLGSEHYVSELSNPQLRNIVANLNFDMLGSANYVRFVYDGDGDETGPSGPPGSPQIEDMFTDYFAGHGMESDAKEFNGRSDYGPFIAVGIPAGGLSSGSDGTKTEEQAEIYGGTAGEIYAPCYHKACDTMNTLNTKALGELGDAAAHGIYTLALTKRGFFEDGSMRTNRRSQAPAPTYDGPLPQR